MAEVTDGVRYTVGRLVKSVTSTPPKPTTPAVDTLGCVPPGSAGGVTGLRLAADRPVAVHRDGVIGVWPPLRDGYQSRFDQF